MLVVTLILTDKEKSRREFLEVHEVRNSCGMYFPILDGASSFLKLQGLFKGLAREVPYSAFLPFILVFFVTPAENNAAPFGLKIFTGFGEASEKTEYSKGYGGITMNTEVHNPAAKKKSKVLGGMFACAYVFTRTSQYVFDCTHARQLSEVIPTSVLSPTLESHVTN